MILTVFIFNDLHFDFVFDIFLNLDSPCASHVGALVVSDVDAFPLKPTRL